MHPIPMSSLHAKAAQLDDEDPLYNFRSRFSIPAPVYLCGLSLGVQPFAAAKAVRAHLEKWAKQAVAGHFAQPSPWASIEDDAAKLYMPIVGAKTDCEVAVMNSLTVNLHLFMTAFYQPEGHRNVILLEDGAFSSDEYACQTHVASRGLDPAQVLHRLKPRAGETLLRDEDILDTIRALSKDGRLALVLLPGVQYYTGQVFPMKQVCEVARECDVHVGFDLAHAVGNVELKLHDWGVDFAAWCSYKYVNGGPGSVSGAFLHERHADASLPRFGGWWGHDRRTRFEMPREFKPQRGIQGWQISNPPVLAVVPVAAALREMNEAGLENMRKKSMKLSGWLIELLDERLADCVQLVSPREVERRGCQVSLRVTSGGIADVNDRLEQRGVVCDVREPDVLRVAPAPLYNSFEDVVSFVEALEEVLDELGLR